MQWLEPYLLATDEIELKIILITATVTDTLNVRKTSWRIQSTLQIYYSYVLRLQMKEKAIPISNELLQLLEKTKSAQDWKDHEATDESNTEIQ